MSETAATTAHALRTRALLLPLHRSVEEWCTFNVTFAALAPSDSVDLSSGYRCAEETPRRQHVGAGHPTVGHRVVHLHRRHGRCGSVSASSSNDVEEVANKRRAEVAAGSRHGRSRSPSVANRVVLMQSAEGFHPGAAHQAAANEKEAAVHRHKARTQTRRRHPRKRLPTILRRGGRSLVVRVGTAHRRARDQCHGNQGDNTSEWVMHARHLRGPPVARSTPVDSRDQSSASPFGWAAPLARDGSRAIRTSHSPGMQSFGVLPAASPRPGATSAVSSKAVSFSELLPFLGPVARRLQPHRSKHPGPRVDQAPVDSRRPQTPAVKRVKARLGADRRPTIARVISTFRLKATFTSVGQTRRRPPVTRRSASSRLTGRCLSRRTPSRVRSVESACSLNGDPRRRQ